MPATARSSRTIRSVNEHIRKMRLENILERRWSSYACKD